MKLIIGLALSMMAFSSFAGSVSDKVSEIEMDRNVKCSHVKSSFAICLGTPRALATCRYSETYSCYGAESFKLKLKVKEYYNSRTNSRESVVTSTSIL
jgi:hypothetical protein